MPTHNSEFSVLPPSAQQAAAEVSTATATTAAGARREETLVPPSQTGVPFHLPTNFLSVGEMYELWYGKNGIASCEASSKDKAWRAHFSAAENQRFSRLKQVVVEAFNNLLASAHGPSNEEVVEILDGLLQESGSLTGLVKCLKKKGLVQVVRRTSKKKTLGSL